MHYEYIDKGMWRERLSGQAVFMYYICLRNMCIREYVRPTTITLLYALLHILFSLNAQWLYIMLNARYCNIL